jgi:hypothetical protein
MSPGKLPKGEKIMRHVYLSKAPTGSCATPVAGCTGLTIRIVKSLGLSLAFSCIALLAQVDMGRVTGTVMDPTGAVVAGAAVSLTNDATNVVQKVQSTATGNYVFQAVPVGSYTMRVEAAGFKASVSKDIQVHVQTVVTADVSLEVGSRAEVVNVTSTAPLLQAQDATLGHSVATRSVNDLPLNGRDWRVLANLAPGSYLTGGTNGNSIFSNGVEPGQVDTRVNGVNDNLEVFGGVTVLPPPDAIEEFKLQSGDNSAEFGHSTGAVINAVMKSGTNRLKGDVFEYLRNEALNANDFFSNLNNVKRAMYRQNQFGGVIGGPVYLPKVYNGKNKTFFFFDFQRTSRTQPTTFTDTVPTNAMRSSNFTNLQDLTRYNSGTGTDALGRKFPHGTVLDPATTRTIAAGATDPITGLVNPNKTAAITVRDPFFTGPITGMTDFTGSASQLNLIPAGRIDPNAAKILQLLPSPTSAGLANNYFISKPQRTTNNTYDIKIDENISPRDILFGVFSRSNQVQDATQPFQDLLGSALQTNFININPTYLLTFSETHLFSPSLVNEVRVGINHNYNTRVIPGADTMNVPEQFGIKGIPQTPGNGGLPTFNVNGFSAFGSRRFSPTIQTTEAQDVTENVTLIRGSHQFKAGIQYTRTVGNIIQPAYSRGNLNFTGQYSDIPNANSNLVGIADMLLTPTVSSIGSLPGVTTYDNLGGIAGYNGSNYAGTNYHAPYWGTYVNDSWKITPTLTLNLGLRWDYFAPYSEDDGRQANFVQTNGNDASGTLFIGQGGCNSPRSTAFNSLLAGYNIKVQCLSGNNVNQAQKTNFAPRVGIAYRINPQLVVRAGYGIAYGAFDSVGYGGTLGTNYPFQWTINGPSTNSQTPTALPNGQTAIMENLFTGIALQDPVLVNGVGLGLVGKEYNYRTPYTQSMNLTIQYQFTERDSIQAGYVATASRHQDSLGPHNSPSVILPPGVNQTNYRPFPNLAAGSQFLSSGSNGDYRSLQTSYEHRFRDGLALLANYTFGKCMSNQLGKTGTGPGWRAPWLPGFGIGSDYTLCNADAKHAAHVMGEYALPFGKDKTVLRNAGRVVNAFVGGWHFNYIYTYQSGLPFTVGCPTATTSDFGCNAFMVPGQDPYAGPHNRLQWLNPAAFAQPSVATQIGQTDYAPLGGAANQLRGPSLKNLDASLFKRFTFREDNTLEFRAEAFNISNSVDFSNPGQLNFTNLTNFSSITGTKNNQRLIQLALKLFF